MSDIHTEHTFDADSPPEEVWSELRRARDEALGPADGSSWWLPGWISHCTVLAESDDALTVRKDDEPCAGTTIVVEVCHAGSGSRIRVVQSGFDPEFVARAGPSFWTHADRIAADFELFVRSGVLAGRAWCWPRVDLGFTARAESRTVIVESVAAGSWAETVGLTDGDVVLALAGAPLWGLADLQTAAHTVAPDDEVAVSFVHDRRRCEASAPA